MILIKKKSLVEKLPICDPEIVTQVPTRTGKPKKMGRHFLIREGSGNFEQTGKLREFQETVICNF